MKPAPWARAALLTPLVAVLTFGAEAGARDLGGGWVTDATTCKQIFEGSPGKLSFHRDADLYGSGFIYEKNRLIGKMATCTISRQKEDGDVLHLITTCSTDVALETVQFSLRIESDDRIVRIFPGLPELDTRYYRCNPSQ